MEKKLKHKNILEINVNSCQDCPFKYNSGFEDEEYSCFIDDQNRNIYKRNTIQHVDVIKLIDKKDWCPLINKTVIIKKNTI